MTRIRVGITIGAFAAAFAAASPPSEALETQLTRRYSQWDKAYRQHDVKSLAMMIHPKFKLVTGTGKIISRADYIKSLWKSQPPKIYRTVLLKAARHGGRAVAHTREETGTETERHLHEYRDTWALTNGHWRLRESRTLGER